MKQKNGIYVMIIATTIIAFTEIIGINMQIAFNYLPILFAVTTMILFNLILKKQKIDKKRMIIVNIIILIINAVLTKLITNTISYTSILAVLILCMFIDKINFTQFDKVFIKDIFKYYILPLVVLLFIDIGYTKLMYEVSELYQFWMVNYIYLAMVVLYNILIANIVMVMSVILFKDIIDSKTTINISAKSVFIVSSVIIIIVLVIKMSIGVINENKASAKIDILNKAIQSNNLNEYYQLDLDPSITVENHSEIFDKQNQYMTSFNNILIKGVSSNSELFYKMGTNTIQELVNKRIMNKNEALQTYRENAKNYVDRLNIYIKNLSMQNILNVLIYIGNIIFIYIIYKKSTSSKTNISEMLSYE